jgi:hypothetical protein
MPSRSKLTRWFLIAWAEVRGVLMHAVWVTRCKIVHGAVQQTAIEGMKKSISAEFKSLLYRYLPHLCPLKLPRPPSLSNGHQVFLELFWGSLVHHLV